MMSTTMPSGPNVGGHSAASPAVRSATPRSLLDIFEATVSHCDGRVAIDGGDATLTYGELSAAADELAGRLRARGIGAGDRVGIRAPSGTTQPYVAILGVLRAGAAYVPVDADDPPARATELWRRSGACAVVEEGLMVTELAPGGGSERTASVDDDAWIIFTSGSTGAPKGVAITHRSAAAFVDAEAELWNLDGSDRVLAGLSIGFDASCEEMWLAWRHGAALVPAPRSVVRSGAPLGPWMVAHGITVVSTVPTLAALWDEEALAGVRLLILGGEACPQGLAWRWAAGNRSVWNTYGPTEATVVTTAARILPGEMVTIGWPLSGWTVAVVDQEGEPVALGEPGELVVGGVGLGRYIDSTLDSGGFGELPALGWPRAYRTGDIVRETIDGLEFLGRRDDQVKIGGRRIELGEVDAQLNGVPGVRAACTTVRESSGGNKLLVGYVVGDVDPAAVREVVAHRMPDGLVPLVVVLDSLPMGGSGKVDRKALPWPPPQRAPSAHAQSAITGGERGLSATAAWVADRWAEQLGPVAIDAGSDFFELGGSSLAAAKLVSVLRERYPAVAVADIYEYRRLSQLAARLAQIGEAGARGAEIAPRPLRRLGLMQLAGVLVLFAVASVPWVIGTLAYGNVVALGTPHVAWLELIGAWLLLGSPIAHAAIRLMATRTLLRKLQPGRYSRYSWLACRLWFVDRLAEVTRVDRLGGTPWAGRYARLAGADVGAEARLATVPPAGALLHVGAGATVEGKVDMRGWWIEGQELVVDEIRIGARARVGSRTLLNPGAVIGEGAEVEPGSTVSGNVPAGERWGGAPARYLGPAGEDWPSTPPAPSPRARIWRWMFAPSLVFEGALAFLSVAPAILLLAALGGVLPTLHHSLSVVAAEAVFVVAVSVPTFALLVALTLRLVWRPVRPGWHADYEAVGWALWFTEELKRTASTVLFPLYASLYTRLWFRLMGLKVGRRTEISVATGLNSLVSFGELSHSTDDVGFCGARSRGGWLALEPIAIGSRTFLGPGAVLRGGTSLADDSLIGVMTLAPRRPAAGTSWFGVPALELPRAPDRSDPARTTDPPLRLVLARGAMDLLRIFGPNTISVLLGTFDIFALAWLCAHLGLGATIALAPVLLLASGLLATAITVALKWMVMGRYRRGEHPLWSFFVWRDELINSAQEQLADESLLRFAIGTPLMSLYLRAMGSRVGRGVWCETTAVTEYDMIALGDGAAVNREACLMTHVFQDRLLRIGPTELCAGATLGPTAVVLPDTVVGAGTCVGGHSVVLRGEELPAGTRWHGAPVRTV